MTPRILLTGGGTGGHIYPALGLAAVLQDRCEFLYVGTERGLERQLVPKAGLRLATVPAAGIFGKGPLQKAQGLRTAWQGYREALAVVERFRPHVVVGTGGYVSGPVGMAALRRGVPLVVQEQNVFPGMTNRFLSRWAQAVVVPYPEAAGFFPRQARRRIAVIGNPVRPEFLSLSPEEGRRRLDLGEGPVLLMFGGSQGARAINEAFLAAIGGLDPRWQVVWVTGSRYFAEIRERLALPPGRIQLHPYLDDLPAALAAADLVVGRAGAMTLAEITALGRAAILIPSPNVTRDHQTKNARILEGRGAAVLLPERELSAQRLRQEIEALSGDERRLQAMAAASRGLGDPMAASRLAELVLDIAMGHRGRE